MIRVYYISDSHVVERREYQQSNREHFRFEHEAWISTTIGGCSISNRMVVYRYDVPDHDVSTLSVYIRKVDDTEISIDLHVAYNLTEIVNMESKTIVCSKPGAILLRAMTEYVTSFTSGARMSMRALESLIQCSDSQLTYYYN